MKKIKKYFILLFSIFIFISCGKIEVLHINSDNKKYQEQEVINTYNLKFNKVSETNSGKNIDTLTIEDSKNNNLNDILYEKDLGNKFTLIQTEDYTKVLYNLNLIKTYNHYSQEIPFIWDEGCEELSKKFNLVSNNLILDRKQKIWESLGEQGQKKCLRENYKNTISIEKVDDNFFTINKIKYGFIDKILIDISSLNLYYFKDISFDKIVKIEKINNMVYLQWSSNRGNDGGLLLIDLSNGEQINLFRNDESEENYKEIIDYLLIDKQIEIKYKLQNGNINIENINI